ncbi:MDR family MFS transporter [Tersicoccus sp. Bi-70]|uniref:MDR family MFS transporter n=1 Tax=Tersicoccus sp. Bi-70 TaxID=1897634 RepID=UPI0009782B4F|nr:MDR family MFS transporter [Tersicoccus sp. Bi-70]OMH33081.1 MFS transporter [Tersicoccus sp. Bi-70]
MSSTTAAEPVASTTPPDEPHMSHKEIMAALTGLLAAFFTAILSSTIVANALPRIVGDLHGTQTDFAWIITAALLANAASTPIWGKLADLFDKKLLVQISIVMFVLGSIGAGIAQTIPVMMVGRVVQGLAMGGLTALAQAILGTIIPPRQRGRYAGYMGAVMAVAMSGGPLLGGLIVDSPLGWRGTFFVCVPLAVIALIIIQLKLHLGHLNVKRRVSIDWVGAVLLAAAVSILLIWVSFAGKADYYDWWSPQTVWMVGGSLVLIALFILVESKVSEPIVPLKIVSERTTALAIIASVAVGIGLFGGNTYLGQYFQVARGYTPTEAGLLMLPMIFGNLIATTVAGQLITRFGKWKRYLVIGSVLLIAGLGLASTLDHTTPLWQVSIYIFLVGLGTGALMQNLVLAVQNTVRAQDIGAASASVAFFRSFGGAIGVAVLGAVLGNRVTDLTTQGLAAHGIRPSGGTSGASLDLNALPGPVREVIQAAYGDATGLIFRYAAIVAIVVLIAVLLIKERTLRSTIDIKPSTEPVDAAKATPPSGSIPIVGLPATGVTAAGTVAGRPSDDARSADATPARGRHAAATTADDERNADADEAPVRRGRHAAPAAHRADHRADDRTENDADHTGIEDLDAERIDALEAARR